MMSSLSRYSLTRDVCHSVLTTIYGSVVPKCDNRERKQKIEVETKEQFLDLVAVLGVSLVRGAYFSKNSC